MRTLNARPNRLQHHGAAARQHLLIRHAGIWIVLPSLRPVRCWCRSCPACSRRATGPRARSTSNPACQWWHWPHRRPHRRHPQPCPPQRCNCCRSLRLRSASLAFSEQPMRVALAPALTPARAQGWRRLLLQIALRGVYGMQIGCAAPLKTQPCVLRQQTRPAC